jgi:hypothetical protein
MIAVLFELPVLQERRRGGTADGDFLDAAK